MSDSFDAYELIAYLRGRWKFVPLACVAAAIAALAGSVLLPKKYSATASILIAPPATSDPRAVTAVSPIYLESLKTYEHFANSDSLFRKAAQRYHLQADAGQPIEALKRQVLRVSKLRDIKILQITVTLPDPKKAAEVAAFLASETVALSRAAGQRSDSELVETYQARLDAAEKAVVAAQRALEQEDGKEPIDSLRYRAESLMELRAGVERDLLATRASLAERADDSLARRAAELERQSADLDRQIRAKNENLALRNLRRTELQETLAAAARDRDALREHVRTLRSNAGVFGEQLQVIDSGAVPQEPSSPRTALLVALAVVLALAVSLLALAVGLGLDRRRSASVEAVRRAVA